MSGGEKKMVSIATILGMEPDIILMDEPSIALEPAEQKKSYKYFKGNKAA